MPQLNLTAVNELSEIPRVVSAVEAFGEARKIPSGVLAHVGLALDELLTNVITYGFDTPGPHEIEIALTLGEDGLRIRLEDGGRPFNPLESPPPDLDLDLEDRPIGGLGLHLVREMMDDLRYRREDGRNVLTMFKPLTPKAGTP